MNTIEHPAKFTPEILEIIGNSIKLYACSDPLILDPFAGTGRIHYLGLQSYAIELEREWAELSELHGPTWCGDFFSWNGHPFSCVGETRPTPELFNVVTTSCTYGNRMADCHHAQERCKACTGSGTQTAERAEQTGDPSGVCVRCEGKGRRVYKRHTYTHTLGRKLSPNNSGAMQWGTKYKEFHLKAWQRTYELLEPNGLFILNVKDHYRNKRLQFVPNWHKFAAMEAGFKCIDAYNVPVRGMGHGQHQHTLKVDHEMVYVFRKS